MTNKMKFVNILISGCILAGLGIWNDEVFSFAQFVLCAVICGLALGGVIDD